MVLRGAFSPWSPDVCLLYAPLAHARSLNAVCDALRLWATPLRAWRGATPPSRNNLSYANQGRDGATAGASSWDTLAHGEQTFVGGGRGPAAGLAHRCRRSIHIVDSTVVQLMATCLDRVRHRRRKAAAKCRRRLHRRRLLPARGVIGSVKEHHRRKLEQLCAGRQAGEVVLFDKGYHVFDYFWALTQRAVFFVTRAQDKLHYRVVKNLPKSKAPRELKAPLIVLKTPASRKTIIPGACGWSPRASRRTGRGG